MAYDVFFDNSGVLSVPPQFSDTVDLTHANNNPGFLANGGISEAFGLNGSTPAALRAATSAYILIRSFLTLSTITSASNMPS